MWKFVVLMGLNQKWWFSRPTCWFNNRKLWFKRRLKHDLRPISIDYSYPRGYLSVKLCESAFNDAKPICNWECLVRNLFLLPCDKIHNTWPQHEYCGTMPGLLQKPLHWKLAPETKTCLKRVCWISLSRMRVNHNLTIKSGDATIRIWDSHRPPRHTWSANESAVSVAGFDLRANTTWSIVLAIGIQACKYIRMRIHLCTYQMTGTL